MHPVYTDSSGIEIIKSEGRTKVWVTFNKIRNRPDYDKVAYVTDPNTIHKYKDSDKRQLISTVHLTLYADNKSMALPK